MGRHSAPRRGLLRPADTPGQADSASVTPPDSASEAPSGGASQEPPGGTVSDGAAVPHPAGMTDLTRDLPVVPDAVLPEVVLGGGALTTTAPVVSAHSLSTVTDSAVTAPTVSVPTVTVPTVLTVPTGTVPTIAGAPATTGRAGRNLPLAVGVGLALGAMVLVPLFTYPPAFVLVLVAAVCIGIHETVRAVQRVEARPPVVPLLAGGVGMTALAWFAGPEALLVGLLLTVVALPVWRLADGSVGYQRDVTAGALVSVYVPFLAGFCVLLLAQEDGALRVAAFVATVVCSDTGGYIAGVLFGKHPMAPTVSPKKSWEGFAGSLLFCAVGGACFLVFGFGGQWWHGVLYGVAIAATATLGDLAESMIKRDLNIKDMGTLLPGHGGVMDRLDSLLLAAPVAYLLLTLFAPPS